MASGKYSGAYVPGAGGDDPPAPKRSLAEKYGNTNDNFDARSRRREDKLRVREWMNGREPVEWWEYYDGPPRQQYLCMEFPTTVHYFVVAYERAPEYGKLYTWCFGCKCHDCGACEWARNAYAAALREEFKRGDARADDLPF